MLSLFSFLLVLMMSMMVSSFVPMPHQQRPTPFTVLNDSEYPWEGSNSNNQNDQSNSNNELTKFQTEETLLQIHCKPMHDTSLVKVAVPRVRKYVQEFLFHNALPVQSLKAVPTPDGGLELIFWKKGDPTQADGGMRFFIVAHAEEEENEGVEIVVKRESEGQAVCKSTTEKLVVQAFLQAFTGKDREKKYAQHDPPTHDVVTMESVYHKWMFSA